ncbi:MAG: outer membrane beta-barrel protein [Hellea sp.]
MTKTLTLKSLFITAITFSAVSALPGSAAAQDSYAGIYANIGISQLSADLDLSDLDLENNRVDLGQENVKALLVNGRLGYRVNRMLAVEGDVGFGLGGDNFQRTIPVDVNPLGVVNVDADVDLDVKSYFGVFARGILPVSEKFDLFARAGYGTAKAEATATGSTALLPGFSATATESQSSSGFAYGVGAEYHIDARHGIRIDYSSIGNDASFIAAAYTVRF